MSEVKKRMAIAKKKRKIIIKLLGTADFNICTMDQLITIINLFDYMNIPMKKGLIKNEIPRSIVLCNDNTKKTP